MSETEQSESEKARAIFSRLCHDAGLLDYRIQRLAADLEDLRVKIRNAARDYEKAKALETNKHPLEVTNPEGVTQ